MSFLDGSSFSASFTFLGLDFGALDNDPYRSRNTIASAQNAYKRGIYSDSIEIKPPLGAGAVFEVTLRRSKTTGELFAVKTAHTANPPTRLRTGSANTGVFAVLREIQVVSHAVAEAHPNILNVIGWDWGQQRMPVVFVEYAELKTLKDFLPTHGALLKSYEKRKLCLDVACGLNALHSIDIAHGDVKLANTLVFRNPKGGYIAKVSDFSHAIFGLSTRRKSAYPGSRLYNAPEIRKPDSVVLSDRLPRCETFSFGLLVWEILKNGSHFFERGWIEKSSTTSSSLETQGSSLDSLGTEAINHMIQTSIESLGPDGLLNKAQSFSGVSGITPLDESFFYRIFTITLRDRADLRRDMQTVAMALDTYDEGKILHYSHRLAVRSFAVWDFNPLSPVPWTEQVAFVGELRTELAQPLQPSHAELHFILSRCYAEGYGVHKDANAAIMHLYRSASLDNVEATCLIEVGNKFFSEFDVKDLPKLAQNDISKCMRAIRAKVLGGAEREQQVSLAAYVRAWNDANREFVKKRQFFWHDGKNDRAYDWNSQSIQKFITDVARAGEPIYDISITYASLVSSFNSSTFYEMCASFGISGLFLAMSQTSDDDYTQSSWGDPDEVWSRLLNAAAKCGEVSMLQQLLAYGSDNMTRQWKSPTGESPLHYLSFLKQDSAQLSTLVKAFLDLGMDINGVALSRTWVPPFSIELSGTPLHIAVQVNCEQTVRLLVQHGADPFETFGDIGSPFQMAASLHLHSVIRELLQAARIKIHHVDQAFKAIGLPTKKGWFDRCQSISHLSSSNILRRDIGLTCEALLGSNRSVYEEWNRAIAIPATFWPAIESKRIMLDGWPLIECIAQGQRDLVIPQILIELGLHPITDAARYKLLLVVLQKWEGNPDDPYPAQLLRLVLGAEVAAHQTLGSYTSHHWHTWKAGWHQFFETYRHSCSSNIEVPTLHSWVLNGDLEAVRILTTIFETVTLRSLVSMLDSAGRSALQLAIDQGSRSMYYCLRPYKTTTIADDIFIAKSSYPSSPLLPVLVNLQQEETEFAHFERISKIIRAETEKTKKTSNTDTMTCCSSWAISDALIAYAEWALEAYRWHLPSGARLQPHERLRHEITEVCFLTAIALRMKALDTKKVSELDELECAGRIPACVGKFYQFESTGYLNGHPTGLKTARARLLGRIQRGLKIYHSRTIPWTQLYQRPRVGQLAVLEWFRERYFTTVFNSPVDFEEDEESLRLQDEQSSDEEDIQPPVHQSPEEIAPTYITTAETQEFYDQGARPLRRPKVSDRSYEVKPVKPRWWKWTKGVST